MPRRLLEPRIGSSPVTDTEASPPSGEPSQQILPRLTPPPEGLAGLVRTSSASSLSPRTGLLQINPASPLRRQDGPDAFDDAVSVARQLSSLALNPNQRLDVAQRAAQRCPQLLLEHALGIDVGTEHDRSVVAAAVLTHPSINATMVDVAQLPHRFALHTPAAMAPLLPALVERHGMDLTDCLDKLGLQDSVHLALDSAIWDFQMQGESAALAVAKSLLAFHAPDPMRAWYDGVHDPVASACAALHASNADDTSRLKLARLIAERRDGDVLLDRIRDSFASAEIRRELGLSIVRNSWQMYSLAEAADLTGDLTATALAQQEFCVNTWAPVAHENGKNAEQLFSLPPPQLTLQDRSKVYAHAVKLAAQVDHDVGVSFAVVGEALYTNYFDSAACSALLSEPPKHRAAKAVAMFGWEPVLTQQMSHAAKLKIEHQDARYEWIASAALLLGRQDPQVQAKLAPTLDCLGRVRPPDLRVDLTRALAEGVHAAGADAVVLFAGSGQFHRRHMQVFAATLARVYARDGSELPTALRKVLSHTKLKDGSLLRAVSRHLLTIMGSQGLPISERQRLIELAASAGGSPNYALDRFVKTTQRLGIASRAVQQQLLDPVETRHALSQAHSCNQLDAALRTMVRRVVPGSVELRELDDPQLEANLNRFLSESRQPEAFINYAQAIRCHIAGELADTHQDPETDMAPADDIGEADSNASHNDASMGADLLKAIDLFADAVIWSTDKTRSFAELRYDTQASAHLAYIAANAPDTWTAWRRDVPTVRVESSFSVARGVTVEPMHYLRQRVVTDGHVPAGTYPDLQDVLRGKLALDDAMSRVAIGSEEQRLLLLLDPATTVEDRSRILHRLAVSMPANSQFRRDLEDLKGLLRPRQSTLASMNIVDTDDAEDLLLCGTEVAGSCQHVDAEFESNKALVGYAVDGKYRMIAAKGDDGRLAARRMLRLLLDEQGKPALYLERLYANAGIVVGDALDGALVDLAKKKAEAMGCALLSNSADVKFYLHKLGQPSLLGSLDSRAPFEYVDANGEVAEREYTMRAWAIT